MLIRTTLTDLQDQARTSRFHQRLLKAIQEGRRDFSTGYDQVACEQLDPRVSGSVDGELILARALASAWRCPENDPPTPIVILVGHSVKGQTRLRPLPMDEWSFLSEVLCYADGVPAVLPSGARIRRFVVHSEATSMARVFLTSIPEDANRNHANKELINSEYWDAQDWIGSLTLRLGLPTQDGVLAEALRTVGLGSSLGPVAVALLLAAPVPVQSELGEAGGPQNAWRTALVPHLDGTHLTPILAKQLQGEGMEPTWHSESYRAELFDELRKAKGSEPTKREFLNALANAQPLRNILAPWLTRYFPEIEALFWCCGSVLWDESSPAERLALLRAAVPQG